MTRISEVDSARNPVLVDNATDMLSSTPAHVESEGAGLMRRGVRVMGGKCLCCAAHGLSCLVTATRGGVRHTLLFDTGPEEYAFERNVTRLAADLGAVEAIVLSHGHWDHAGAMLLALTMIRGRNGGKEVAFHGHPEMFHSRAVKLPNGGVRQMEDVPSVEALTSFGAQRDPDARAAIPARRHVPCQRRNSARKRLRARLSGSGAAALGPQRNGSRTSN